MMIVLQVAFWLIFSVAIFLETGVLWKMLPFLSRDKFWWAKYVPILCYAVALLDINNPRLVAACFFVSQSAFWARALLLQKRHGSGQANPHAA